jgi:tRNA (uracil-5-)-methyltransferase TRM9
MTPQVIQRLNQLNRDFYTTVATDFSETRQQAWEGWEQLVTDIERVSIAKKALRVLDIGCGNGRFLHFLQQHFPQQEIHYYGVDNNTQLLRDAKNSTPHTAGSTIELAQQDIVAELLNHQTLPLRFTPAHYDVIVMFGVLHHIPSAELRTQLLTSLAAKIETAGLFVFTTWQFDRLPNLWSRQLPAKELGFQENELEQNDFLLTWERGTSAIRYCHLTSDEEAKRLIAVAQLQLQRDFDADGKKVANHYFLCTPSLRP